MSAPWRLPLVCGALGRYDRDRVLRTAAAIAPELRIVHEDRRSILCLDREPLRWSGDRGFGLAWADGEGGPAAVDSWRHAASDLNACGLFAEGRRRLVHSSVSGAAPLYHHDDGRATYFATAVDPLAGAREGLLTIDWEAWAAILCLGNPLGTATPFAEIRRLAPFSLLERHGPRAVVVSPPWPWLELEPTLDVPAATPEVLEALRAEAERIAEAPVVVPLSGGWDSRLIISLLTERGARVRAVTLNDDSGRDYDERIAAIVAEELGVPHEIKGLPEPERFWEDFTMRLERVDYQVPGRAWLAALVRHLAGIPAVVTDGVGLEHLAQPPGRWVDEEMLSLEGPEVGLALWRTLAWRRPLRAYEPKLARALRSLGRSRFIAESAKVAGHPAEATLTLYRTRSVRNLSTTPMSTFGRDLAMRTPFISHRVAVALLAATPRAKLARNFYDEIFAAVNPRIWALPSTHRGMPPYATDLPRRWRSRPAFEHYHDAIVRSPIRGHLRERLQPPLTVSSLERVGRKTPWMRWILGLTTLTLWHDRYRDRLREIDPGEIL